MRWSCLFAIPLLSMLACTAGESDDGATAATGESSGPADTTGSSEASASAETSATAETTATVGSSDSGVDTSTASASASASATGESTGAGTTGADAVRVQFTTTMGDIVFELDEVEAPITTANFLAYVDAGFYDGTDGLGATIVHRVVPGFVIQGGGLTAELDQKATMPPIVNESSNGLPNVRGSISMARTNDPDSATSQFFVNLVDNPNLDDPPGYAVFGAVVEGMDVVDAIAAVETADEGPYQGVPVEDIVVTSATRL